jgi:hypothetical protein
MENESHYGVVSTDVLKHFGVEEWAKDIWTYKKKLLMQ